MEGKSSGFFPIKQGVAQVVLCHLHFLIYINGLLCEIEKCPKLCVKFSENTLISLLFTDNFVGVLETGSALITKLD